MSFRNIYYDKKAALIHHWGWNDQGEPTYKTVPFTPYLYVPTANPKEVNAIGIDDKPLTRKDFKNEWERNKFVDSCKSPVYFNLPSTQQYLLDNYYKSSIEDLTQHPLRIFYFDIEVIADEFPKADEAKFPMTSITIYDSKTKKYYVWGCKSYDHWSCKDHLEGIEPEEIVYELCASEAVLLKKFIRFWRANFPDLISGYNSNSFDIPYIVNRINKVLGTDKAKRLSPVDVYYGMEKTNKFLQTYIQYVIEGISHVDYMELYKSFTAGERESDALEFVAQEVLDIGKLDYGDMSLQELYVKDWNKFINYNIWDVKLLVMIDDRMKYMDVAKFTAFGGFCNIEKAFGKVEALTGWLAKESLMDGKIIPTQHGAEKETIPGGYVKEIQGGIYNILTSIDLNSLYPSIIITLNLSPETKMAKLIRNGDKFQIYFFKENGTVDIEKEDIGKFATERNWAMSASGIFFDQSKKSVCSKFTDDLYAKRKSCKKIMLDAKNKLKTLQKGTPEYIKTEADTIKYDTYQYLYKILLNSLYGALANRFFPLYDIDCAKSITLTGQSTIKKSEKIVNEYIEENWGKMDDKEIVVGMDTDSLYLRLEGVVGKEGIEIRDEKGDLNPRFKEIIDNLTTEVNVRIKKWAEDALYSKDPRFEFKRESVCTRAIWIKKKHYILHIIDNEGVKMDKFKYSGVALAKSTYSAPVKQLTKRMVESIMLVYDKKTSDNLFFDAYEDFKKLPLNEIAERTSIKVLSKWEGRNKGMLTEKGTTKNARYSIYHNELLKELHVDNKYRKIDNGSKIKMVAVQPNRFRIDGIAFQDELPSEFDLIPDYEHAFFKGVVKCAQPIYDALGWQLPDPKKQFVTSIEDLFGGD